MPLQEREARTHSSLASVALRHSDDDVNSPLSAPEFPALAIDGSSSGTFAGMIGPKGNWLAQCFCEKAPLEGLFPTVKSVLAETGQHFGDIRSYLYCEGPGSVLGLRLCAMAIETWSRLYPDSAQFFAYNSLQLAAVRLVHDTPDLPESLVISDWKKTAWNAVRIQSGQPATTEALPADALARWDGPVYHLPARKGWQSPPAGARQLDYDPAELRRFLQAPGLLRPTETIQLYSAGTNAFQKWTPTRHRAN